jgi:hypothetical protein
MVNGNRLGEVGFQYLGVSYSTMDCQAFVERCLKDCGCNKDLAGSNAWFREVYKNGEILTPEECVKKYGKTPKGAFLFILEHDGKEPEKYKPDGLGNASHIGICTMPTGEGAIHSSKSKGGVCESKYKNKSINGGWNRVGLWTKEVEYSGVNPEPSPEPGPSPEPEPTPTPEPSEPVLAVVWSANGKPVNTRKGPGTSYPMSKAGRIDVGTTVEVMDDRNGWSHICVVDKHDAMWFCYMKSEFLRPLDTPEPEPDDPTTTLYTVTIKHLPYYQAEALKNRYDGAVIIKEE